MKLSTVIAPFLLVLPAIGSVVPVPQSDVLKKGAISSDVYNDLVWYFRYSSSAYDLFCLKPNGNTFIAPIYNPVTDTVGFIARDDNRQEVVIALRGSLSVTNVITDLEIILKRFTSPGTSPPDGVYVHTGFLNAWNSVASHVISTVGSVLADYPHYSIKTTGHSLGGALASLASITLLQNFPNNALQMYTYGQPRTGNAAYATWINDAVGVNNIFRSVHTNDGVPTIIPRFLGYRHHATEFWQILNPASVSHVEKCNSGGEDPTCSDSIPSAGIDIAHTIYYNILATTPFCS